jgi:septum formation protein
MLLPVLDKLNSYKIVLASASINRKNILEKAGLKFEVSASTFEENLPHSDFESSETYVVKTSEMKLHHKL